MSVPILTVGKLSTVSTPFLSKLAVPLAASAGPGEADGFVGDIVVGAEIDRDMARRRLPRRLAQIHDGDRSRRLV